MSDKPVRVQLSRKKGWRMPENKCRIVGSPLHGETRALCRPRQEARILSRLQGEGQRRCTSGAPSDPACFERRPVGGRAFRLGALLNMRAAHHDKACRLFGAKASGANYPETREKQSIPQGTAAGSQRPWRGEAIQFTGNNTEIFQACLPKAQNGNYRSPRWLLRNMWACRSPRSTGSPSKRRRASRARTERVAIPLRHGGDVGRRAKGFSSVIVRQLPSGGALR